MKRGVTLINPGFTTQIREPNYSALLCSLPNLIDPFKYQSQSISYVQLTKRMNMLEGDDYDRIQEIRALFYWGGLKLNYDEIRLVNEALRFVKALPYQDIRSWLNWRMDIRAILAAMRKRRNGDPAPAGANWSYGPSGLQITRNWSSPCFKLEHRYPFLPTILEHLNQGQSFEVEKVLLKSIWHFYNTCRPDKSFGFSAVVLYVMKWDLVNRWQQYDRQKAKHRFDELVESSLPTMTLRAS